VAPLHRIDSVSPARATLSSDSSATFRTPPSLCVGPAVWNTRLELEYQQAVQQYTLGRPLGQALGPGLAQCIDS
jgi:hypothetical protein